MGVNSKKKHKVEEMWWDHSRASLALTSTLLSLSHDQQRLCQRTHLVDLTSAPDGKEEDNGFSTHNGTDYSSDYCTISTNIQYAYSDITGDEWQGEEYDEYPRFWEALNESGVTEDAILQALNRAEAAQAAQVDIKMTRRYNPHSDNPHATWIPFWVEYLDEMLYTEGRSGCPNICWTCNKKEAMFRCVDEECFGGGMMCSTCTVDAHARLPLHWIEEWNGSFFMPTSLKELGLKVYLGHPGGQRCHYSVSGDCDFTVLHVNKVHQVAVSFALAKVTILLNMLSNFCGHVGIRQHWLIHKRRSLSHAYDNSTTSTVSESHQMQEYFLKSTGQLTIGLFDKYRLT
ncbi:hypothetical protein K435DRAFT_867411 [Dendrothele bispora CBS 962.96]|uniref:CxC2-like cysteine cluster KDZ transposase-associated domain-containing protein n=1 Tax=Dendrothele bispora (strain CBS 962.96) TaxID=1314807 RepID=A0A4S8LEV0_DENBC|nr:hypothetical protein K435DRAFT_867411 [Dendrothele bispora CBS 962.96]